MKISLFVIRNIISSTSNNFSKKYFIIKYIIAFTILIIVVSNYKNSLSTILSKTVFLIKNIIIFTIRNIKKEPKY